MNTNTPKNTSETRIATVRAIGAGERKLADSADEIFGGLPADATKTDATPAVYAWLGLNKDNAPKQMDANKNKTDFGRGFGSLVSAVANRIASNAVKPTRLTVNLSGDDVTGGTVTIDSDHPMFEGLMSLFNQADDAELADAA